MRDYQLLKTTEEFEYVLIGLSYVHPISFVQEVEELLAVKGYEGYVLLDGLLSNGFSDNRFAKIYFNGISFDMGDVQLVDYVSDELNNSIYKYFKNNVTLTNGNNILPDSQIYLLKKGILIKDCVSS